MTLDFVATDCFRRTLIEALITFAALAPVANAAPRPKPSELTMAWGDQGDGGYVNPILPADFSDIDAIRVDDDYYAISSTLHQSPGMAVLHSRDLVNWRIIGHAIADVTQIGAEMNWDRMNRYGRGVWAGAIRHHGGKFWIYFGAPDEGLFMTTAEHAAGPWEPLHQVWKTSGWNDTCPFWDDDGQGYLITTQFAKDPVTGAEYNIHLFRMGPNGKRLLRESDRIIHRSRGSEASKLYKIDGTYYHFYSEVKSEGRVTMMNRSKSLDGPWETRQLSHVDAAVDKSPNQGGMIQTRSGDWWFVTHQGAGDWEGRAMALLPVTWIDGWPIIGQPGDDGIGDMVWASSKPVNGFPTLRPETDDEFDAPTLSPQWGWNHHPRADKWSLTERPGFLRLHAFKPLRASDLKKAGNTLSQRSMRTAANEITAKLDISGMVDGQVVGLCHLSRAYSTLGVSQAGDLRTLVYTTQDTRIIGPVIAADTLWLRSKWGHDGVSTYAYSIDGKHFSPFGDRWQLSWGHYRGDRVGVFCYNNQGEAGHVDIDSFRYAFSGPGPITSASTPHP